ncbi:MAP kinase kinase kinase kinase activity protein [Marasmius sp. AFHP31]|nr:MAP kinase kinase kinase kinase activity protein [Marasmius sp. AFHP31]
MPGPSPASISRRNRYIPLPSQAPDDEDVIIHPTLEFRSNGVQPEHHLRTIGTIVHPRSEHPASAHLSDSATVPRLQSLAVVHPDLPWPITVHPSKRTPFVTVFDVIRAISEAMEIPIDHSRRRIDLVGRGRKFLGLRKSEMGGDVWEMCLV